MRKSDKRLIIILAIACAATWVLLRSTDTRHGKVVLVRKDQKQMQRIDLNKVKGTARLPLAVDDGQLVIEYDQEGVRVLSSPCPDKVCVHQGKITRSGQTIACVPEKILITLISSDKEETHDAVVR